MERLKVIQVGAGGFGKFWLNHIRNVKSIEIVAIADVVEEHLLEARQIAGDTIPLFQSHEQAFREVKADLALLITPPPTRHRMTRDALQAGMHVIMEKPVASNFQEALELQQMAKQFDKVVAVNQNYRWSAPMQAIKSALKSGLIGKAEIGEWQFERNNDARAHRPQSDWRKGREEPLLTELSIHHFDLMRYLLDRDPVSVFAKSFHPSWDINNGHTSASAIFEFDEGIHINYFATTNNRGKDTAWAGNFRLIGSSGALELTDNVAYHVSKDGIREPLAIPELEYATMDYTVHEFVEAIRENRLPVTCIDDNLISFSMVGGAIESSRTGNKVNLDCGYYKTK